MLVLARVIRIIGGLIAAILVLGIVLVLVDANENNALVGAVLDVGRFFADPFRRIITMDDADVQIAINWGIAALVYLLVAALIAAAIAAVARRVAER